MTTWPPCPDLQAAPGRRAWRGWLSPAPYWRRQVAAAAQPRGQGPTLAAGAVVERRRRQQRVEGASPLQQQQPQQQPLPPPLPPSLQQQQQPSGAGWPKRSRLQAAHEVEAWLCARYGVERRRVRRPLARAVAALRAADAGRELSLERDVLPKIEVRWGGGQRGRCKLEG